MKKFFCSILIFGTLIYGYATTADANTEKSLKENPALKAIKNTEKYDGSYNGKKYRFVFEAVSWHEAKRKAEIAGGNLACVETKEELEYLQLVRQLKGGDSLVWVGLTDSETEGKWRWICDQPLNRDMIFALQQGPELDERDYGHMMRKAAFLSRNENGDIPRHKRGAYKIEGYLIEFEGELSSTEWQSSIDAYYQANATQSFTKLLQARELLNSWRGQTQKLIDAEEILQEIIKKDKDFAPAFKALGRVYQKQSYINSSQFRADKLHTAEQFLSEAIQLEQEYAEAYILLADIYIRTKRFVEAKAALLNANKYGADPLSLHLSWGELLNKQGKIQLAIKHYEHVLQSSETDSQHYIAALTDITSYQVRTKQYEKANEGHKKQIEIRPNDAWTWGNYAGFLLYRYKDIDGAIEKANKAISIMNYGNARLTLACALYTKWAALKDTPTTEDEAKNYFEQAQSIFPYTQKIIEQLAKYQHTQATAIALQKSLTNTEKEPVLI